VRVAACTAQLREAAGQRVGRPASRGTHTDLRGRDLRGPLARPGGAVQQVGRAAQRAPSGVPVGHPQQYAGEPGPITGPVQQVRGAAVVAAAEQQAGATAGEVLLLRWRDGGEHGLPGERVPPPRAAVRAVRQQVRVRGAQRVDRPVRRHAEQVREKIHAGLAGQDRGGRDHTAGLGRQRRHPFRHQRGQRGRQRRDSRFRRSDQLDQFLHQDRQAVRGVQHPLPYGRRQRAAGARLRQRHHVGGRQPLQPHQIDIPPASQAAQCGGRRFLVAGGGDDREPGPGDRARQVAEQRRGVRVGPVQVVEQECRAGRREHPQQAFAEHQRGVDQRLGHTRGRPVGAQPAQRREIRPDLGCLHRSVQPPDRLRHGPVGAGAVDRRTAQYGQSQPGGDRRYLVEEAALADAGLTQHESGPAVAGRGGRHQSAQPRQLGRTSDQRPRHRLSTSASTAVPPAAPAEAGAAVGPAQAAVGATAEVLVCAERMAANTRRFGRGHLITHRTDNRACRLPAAVRSSKLRGHRSSTPTPHPLLQPARTRANTFRNQHGSEISHA
jgi:hypothetical protein